MRAALAALLLPAVCLAAPVLASAPESSLFPLRRPATEAAPGPAAAPAGPAQAGGAAAPAPDAPAPGHDRRHPDGAAAPAPDAPAPAASPAALRLAAPVLPRGVPPALLAPADPKTGPGQFAPSASPLPLHRPAADAAPALQLAALVLPHEAPPALLAPADLPEAAKAGLGRFAPAASLLPQHRPEGDGPYAADPEVGSAAVRPMPGELPKAAGPERVPRPKWRPRALARPAAPPPPEGQMAAAGAQAVPAVLAAGGLAVPRSLLPRERPADFGARIEKASALRVAPQDPAPKGTKGGLCGIAGLQGAKLTPIASGSCGVADPVRVTRVDGIALSTPAVMDCTTAAALTTWVRGSVLPAFGRRGGGVAQLQVAASYSCRPRNNQKGAKLSEHARGRAIDIGAVVLRDGTAVTVLKGWQDRTWGPVLKALHRCACGPFGTVLGPSANAFHRDHLHFDTARYRSGAYCR